MRGPPDSDFDGGVYHGRIVLPPEYPMKPPSIILLTVRLGPEALPFPVKLQLISPSLTSSRMATQRRNVM